MLDKVTFHPGLIRTKCIPPAITRQRVARQALSQKMTQALDCKLTVVTAPAGYGKSTAVIDWLGQTRLPIAWVSLDDNDNHPATFWRYICLALDGALGGVDDTAAYVFASSELMKANVHLHILFDRLAAAKKEIILALDDFHLITTPDLLKSLSYFINYLPSGTHVILVSRTEPELELAKLRVGGDMVRIGPGDLRFQTEEIVRFYQVKGLRLTPEELHRIEENTQGWAAALVAVAMASKGELDSQGFRADEQLIDKFLEEELWRKWPAEKRDFFLKTAILDNLCGSLCDAVTGGSGGSETLRRLWAQNEFVTARGGDDCWYRYHPVFANFLRKQLSRQTAVSLPDLHRRAAQWHREEGLSEAAIDHYIRARQYDTAIELINSQTDMLFMRGEYSRIISWLDRLPEHLIRNSQGINYVHIRYHIRYYMENNQYEQAEKCLDRLRELVDGVSSPCCQYTLKDVLLLESYLLLHRGKTAEFGSKFNAAVAMEGSTILNRGYQNFNPSAISSYRCKALSGFVCSFKTDPLTFRLRVDDYRTLIVKNPGYAPLVVGEFYYETNRPDEALPHLAAATAEAVAADCPGSLVPAMVTIARIKRSRNEMAGALAVVAECEQRLVKINRPHWNYLLEAFKIRLYLDAGRINEAGAWLVAGKLQIYQEVTKTSEYELLVFARVLMEQGCLEDAAILLQRLLTFAEGDQQWHSMVEILNLQAFTAVQTGNLAKALEILEKSLAIGLQEGYVRSFADEFTCMAALLEQYLRQRKQQKGSNDPLFSYAADLLQAMQQSAFQTAFLTPRPTDVRMTVRCFGSFVICRDGQPAHCKNSKAREILAYLVHNQGNPVSWEKIAEALWPEGHLKQVHHNFHATMHLLRKFLKDHALLEILDCSRNSYRIRPEKIDCDMYEFSRIGAVLQRDPAAAAQDAAAVRRLYTGGYFEEDGFAWSYAKAANLERMYLELLKEPWKDSL